LKAANYSTPMLRLRYTSENDTAIPKRDFWMLPVAIGVLLLLVYWVDNYFFLDLYKFGLLPRSWSGLWGILVTPFVHSSVSHLLNNLLPLVLLVLAIRYFYPAVSTRVLISGYLITGVLVWFIARDSYHIGASGQVYAFASFLFFSGIIHGKIHLLAIALLVAFLYGGLIWGIFPFHSHVSWESHLAGGFTGLITALYFRHHEPFYTSPFRDMQSKEAAYIRQSPRAPFDYETSVTDIRFRNIIYHFESKR
jgi:membrane associated rhomboid family serine protease